MISKLTVQEKFLKFASPEQKRTKEIEMIKTEIKNLQVILEAIPNDKTGARMIVLNQISSLTAKLPKFNGRIWWHWLIEYCPKCECNASQGPMAEDLGCDCDLFEKIDKYNDEQKEGETAYKCSCETLLQMRYRHATADMTEDQKKEAYAYMEKQAVTI